MTAALIALVLMGQAQLPTPSPAPAPATERLAAVVVHGNHTTTDADVLAAIGLAIGDPLPPDAVATVRKRLEKTGRYEGIDVRRRYRSIERMDEVVLVILVDERPHSMALPIPEAPPLKVMRPFRKLRDGLMFMPLVSFADGYGLSYGGQLTFADVLGRRGRITVPLTWGAERRAAVEAERKFRRGPISRVEAGAGIVRREHPFFDVPDRRGELWVRAERALPLALRAGGGVRWNDVSFGGTSTPGLDVHERMTAAGVDLTLDTRTDPGFPRNAVYAKAAWEHLAFDARPSRARTTLDARGYLGVIGTSVLAVRAMHGRADGPLPVYEQWMLGGPSSVRGFRTGSFVGDRLTSASAELRIPFSSPIRVGKTGVAIFYDRGAVWNDGQRLAGTEWKQGYGAGVFAIATVFQFRLDVAHGHGRGTRAHVSAGIRF
jgi:outer membrane protein assembly factor BamA